MLTNPTPPREFVTALTAYDAQLRVRWGHRMGHWIIERRMEPRARALVAERPNPFQSPRGWDLYDGWRDGYVHVLTVHPDMLDNRVFQVLTENDTWRLGGTDKLNAAIDAAQAAQEAQEDRAAQTWNEAAAREAHDRLQWLMGNRVAMTPPAQPAYTDAGGFLVRDCRSRKE